MLHLFKPSCSNSVPLLFTISLYHTVVWFKAEIRKCILRSHSAKRSTVEKQVHIQHAHTVQSISKTIKNIYIERVASNHFLQICFLALMHDLAMKSQFIIDVKQKRLFVSCCQQKSRFCFKLVDHERSQDIVRVLTGTAAC